MIVGREGARVRIRYNQFRGSHPSKSLRSFDPSREILTCPRAPPLPLSLSFIHDKRVVQHTHTHKRVAFDDDLHQPREHIFEGIEGNTVITISVKYEFAYNATGKCELKIFERSMGRDGDVNLHKISKYRVKLSNGMPR